VAVVQYTFTHKQLTEKQNKFGKSADGAPVFASYTLVFALQLRKKARENLSQGSRRVPVGTMKAEYIEQNIHNSKNL